MVDATSTRGVRLDPETILDVAEAIAAAEGTAGLTLRRLGSELGVHHTALYRHFRDKDELLLAVADRVLNRRPMTGEHADWRAELGAQMDYGRRRYHTHPDLARLMAIQPAYTPTLLGVLERVLTSLTSIGLDIERATQLAQVIELYVVGAGLYESVIREAEQAGLTPSADAEVRAISALPRDDYPHLVAAAEHMSTGSDEVFRVGVEILLDAIEAAAATHRSAR